MNDIPLSTKRSKPITDNFYERCVRMCVCMFVCKYVSVWPRVEIKLDLSNQRILLMNNRISTNRICPLSTPNLREWQQRLCLEPFSILNPTIFKVPPLLALQFYCQQFSKEMTCLSNLPLHKGPKYLAQ